MKKRAILSVSDKSGLGRLASTLVEQEWELIASGGTARALRAAGLPVTDVAEITGMPEILSGRVKTLHPAIHGAILARDTAGDEEELRAQGIVPIDLVICNLYPFAETISHPGVTEAAAIEQIDIGGVALLRAGAKNCERVTVVCDPADYEAVGEEIVEDGRVGEKLRRQLAAKAFAHTRDYDATIAQYLAGVQTDAPLLPQRLRLDLEKVQGLRYGENPHQAAALYAPTGDAGPLGGTLLQGKALSYNNLLDLDAAWRAATVFEEPAVVIVKHLSPCGVATDPHTPARAFPAALASDPVSAFGGVVACNRPVDKAFAEAVAEADLFVEAIVAPGFSENARTWFAAEKKNCRLLALPGVDLAQDTATKRFEIRTIRAGYLAQERDRGVVEGIEWQVAGKRAPTDGEWLALRFAWKVAPHVRSNAIVFAGERATVGIGGGLPSRVDAVRLAAAKAGGRARGAVMASDAFFPFPDGIEVAAAAGVTAVIQPGGSVRDEEVVGAANRLGLSMVFTGARHFRH